MHEEQHDFTQGSIPRNILSLALPMTAAQLINILYNIVDRMYIGRIPGEGRLALTGLGLCLPIISILIGFANLCGSGGGPGGRSASPDPGKLERPLPGTVPGKPGGISGHGPAVGKTRRRYGGVPEKHQL